MADATGNGTIVLGSRSPRRRQLLEWAEVEFDVLVQDTDESFPAHLPQEDIPVFIAREKARAIRGSVAFSAYPTHTMVLTADTLVMLGDRVIAKPANREEAIEMLQSLSDNTHRVITGVVLQQADREIAFADITSVTFHALSVEQICFYVDKYQPYDKAGAYAIQEWMGVVGIKGIAGDFYNVMGLPVSRVVQAIEQMKKQ